MVFAGYDLSPADFTVIAALRRAGQPYVLAQSVLMARLGLTSGTVSVRLGRLEGKGVVTRSPSSDDARGVLVTLTDKGAQLFDRVAPVHLRNEDVLLSALTDAEVTNWPGCCASCSWGSNTSSRSARWGSQWRRHTSPAAPALRSACRIAPGSSFRAWSPRAERRTQACDGETCSSASGTTTAAAVVRRPGRRHRARR